MFDLSWDEEQALYTVVGAFVVNWGVTESTVSQACDILWAAGGHPDHRNIPKEMGRKLKFIKACFKDYPQLQAAKDFGSSLRGDTNSVLKHREFLLHGVLTEFNRATQTFQFTRLDAGKTEYDQISTRLSVAQLLEIDAAARKIAADWIKLVENLHVIRESKDGLQNPYGVRYITIRERAYRRYQAVKRLICQAVCG